jgi:uncharacterized protein
MSLSRKLSRLSGAGPGTKPVHSPVTEVEVSHEEEDARWSALRSALGKKSTREDTRREQARAARPLPGETTQTEDGPLHVIVRRYPLTHRHGHAAVEPARGVAGALLAQLALDESLASVDASRLVFLDTETTGLAGGTGTIPFLIGIAYYQADSLVVEQWLLRRFGEEAPMLVALTERLASASGIVTYNGKSFDWPLIRTRYVLNKRRAPPILAHVDLLHCARRLVRHRVSSARLTEIERTLLGHARVDDIEGAMIPEVFMALAKHGHHPDVERVIEHNAMDLVAMPALLALLVSKLDGSAEDTDASDHLACARVLSRAGDDAGVSRFAVRACEGGESEPAAHALVLAARHARGRAEHDEALRLLCSALEHARDELTRSHVHLALSKHFEHKQKDLEKALVHARETELAEGEEASVRRVGRIAARMRVGKSGRLD